MSSSYRPILLVEDNPMDVDLTFQAFVQHRIAHPITVCRDGEEAMQYIQAHGAEVDAYLPALVLLDLRLPKIDGMDVLRQARSHDLWKKVPVVVLTTSREQHDIDAAYRLGVNSYLVKPIDFRTFTRVIGIIKAYWLLTNEPPFPHRHAR